MLLDIVNEDMLLNRLAAEDSSCHFNVDMLNRYYPTLSRYLVESVIPLCVYLEEEEISNLREVCNTPLSLSIA